VPGYHWGSRPASRDRIRSCPLGPVRLSASATTEKPSQLGGGVPFGQTHGEDARIERAPLALMSRESKKSSGVTTPAISGESVPMPCVPEIP
jgi:hypothetical protein